MVILQHLGASNNAEFAAAFMNIEVDQAKHFDVAGEFRFFLAHALGDGGKFSLLGKQI